MRTHHTLHWLHYSKIHISTIVAKVGEKKEYLTAKEGIMHIARYVDT